ncbi:uncharacterized protein LOC110054609 [Orbicella faveolata]|uniref:uncharacterized protein LOC110054609 n=1 Tax=Orbicella faveolata TaxID=48498 RepID=UPI0009E3EE12|nr:uncharacterized protein LOC110054609 [Orbicella faveolata]
MYQKLISLAIKRAHFLMISNPESLQSRTVSQDLKMSGFFIRFASVMCLLVILTGPSSAWHEWVSPTYPSDSNDVFYQAFQTVPSLNVTAYQLMTNFLGYPHQRGVTKRQTFTVDTVIVLDGSGSVPRCDFSKAKEALKHLMDTLHKPGYDSKYAAVTFSSTATVNFKFLPYSSAASEITTISYSGGSTNTQAGLAEAKKLFADPNSGTLPIMFLILLLH